MAGPLHEFHPSFVPNENTPIPAHGSSKDHDLRPEDYRTITAILQIQLDEAMNTDAVIAAAQQREFNEEDSRLGKVLRDLRATAPTLFECGICFERFNEDVVANLKPCNHRFCRICIREYAALRIEEHRYPIVCPSCMPDEVRKDTGGKRFFCILHN